LVRSPREVSRGAHAGHLSQHEPQLNKRQVPVPVLDSAESGGTDGLGETKPQVTDSGVTPERHRATMDIFEGTEQIQQLVIARAISGLRIE
jgi:hypothetical protein